MDIVFLVIGLALLLVSGEALVRGAVGLARQFGVSELVIGLTLVGFGTSLPELLASLEAVRIGSPGVAVGNVVGSNTANILLILGASAALSPLMAHRSLLGRDLCVLALSATAAVGLLHWQGAPQWMGGVFLLGLAAYTGWALMAERRQTAAQGLRHDETVLAESIPPANPSKLTALILTLAGFAGVMGGAKLLVGSAVAIATAFGVSEAVIGVTIVAVGTSLPELVTSVMAAWRRLGDVAIGNIIGSNIFNMLGILGTTAAVAPLAVPAEILQRDLWWMMGATAALIALSVTCGKIGRLAGVLMLAAYGVYTTVLILGSGV